MLDALAFYFLEFLFDGFLSHIYSYSSHNLDLIQIVNPHDHEWVVVPFWVNVGFELGLKWIFNRIQAIHLELGVENHLDEIIISEDLSIDGLVFW